MFATHSSLQSGKQVLQMFLMCLVRLTTVDGHAFYVCAERHRQCCCWAACAGCCAPFRRCQTAVAYLRQTAQGCIGRERHLLYKIHQRMRYRPLYNNLHVSSLIFSRKGQHLQQAGFSHAMLGGFRYGCCSERMRHACMSRGRCSSDSAQTSSELDSMA